jgi:ankyrin repeat protein
MIDIPADRCQRYRLFKAIDDGFRSGDLALLAEIFGSPQWVDEQMPFEFGLGYPVEYAIYWSPLAFVEALIEAGADVNYDGDDGFPALIAALSTDRPDRHDLLRVLLLRGADPNRRGINDGTPLHYAVGQRDTEALRLLLSFGADPALATRIDDCATPLEDAESGGFEIGVALLREAMGRPSPPHRSS